MKYYELIPARESYLGIEIEPVDFLKRRQSALLMVLEQIDAISKNRKELFLNHRSQLERRISELRLRFKSIQHGDQLKDPPKIVESLEKNILDLERELRHREVEVLKDILAMEDRKRYIILTWGGLLALGDDKNLERQERGF